ncbi:hypothetical protein VQ056_19435 [Paenibacillus sp. JTLBN-2024]
MQLFRYFICLLAGPEREWIDVPALLRWMEGEGMLRCGGCSRPSRKRARALAGFGWGDVAEADNGRLRIPVDRRFPAFAV